MPNNLPFNFPRFFNVVLQSSVHQGQPQFWGPFLHDHKTYKVVIRSPRGSVPSCKVGETWEVHLGNSPNGHIVFCELWSQIATASGEHPIVEHAARHIADKRTVAIKCRYTGTFAREHPTELGLPAEARIEDGALIMSFSDAATSDSFGYAESRIEPFEIRVSLKDASWHTDDPDGPSLTWKGDDYHRTHAMVFREKTWEEVAQNLDHEEDDCDPESYYFDDPEAYRERQEELFWAREEERDDYDY